MAKENGKGQNGKGQGGNIPSDETERYRRAATDALEMLDWCIGYLVGTHKEGIASQLASNRRFIREKLMREPEEPMPTEKD